MWFVTGFRFASGQCGEENPPALDGLRQEKFKLNLLTDWDFLSQIGKGNIAVNEVSLAQKRCGVKFEISCALLVLAGAISRTVTNNFDTSMAWIICYSKRTK